jgi:hypothetical protein
MIGKFHEGLFGSVTRFIPMSIKGKHFITDIDMKLRSIFLLSRLNEFVKERRGVDYLYVSGEQKALYTSEEHKKFKHPLRIKVDDRDIMLPYCVAGF